MLEKKLRKLSKGPGVYLFLDAKKKIIYVGKASSLKSRVLSYFRASANLSPAKEVMLSRIVDIKIKETDSEIEALLLEANFIKKYQPPFNVVMRDDKSFAYVKISVEEEFPTVFITRRIEKSGRYFGPFTDVGALKEALKVLRRIFFWRPEKCVPGSGRPCFDFQIGRCPGTCIGNVDKKEYAKTIRKVIWFFEGKKGEVIKMVKRELRAVKKGGDPIRKNISNGASEERAHRLELLKHQLHSLEKVLSHANVVGVLEKYEADARELARVLGIGKPLLRIEGYDISNIFGREATGSMVVFKEGEPNKKEYRKFKIRISEGTPNDVGMMTEMLERRFNRYHHKSKKEIWPIPDLIVIDGGKAQLNACSRVLKKYKLAISHVSLAKREEEIYFPGEKKPLKLPRANPALHLLERVRDEAHRFAVSYHRKLRGSKLKV